MIIVDTNIILRYLLNDNIELNQKATEIIDNNNILIPTEVIVEVSYVLKKYYNVGKEKIYEALQELLKIETINFQNRETIELAFKTYSEQNLDVVDCLLFSYYKNEKVQVKTFDDKLNKLISAEV
ncbi:MAG: PIN domain-containing protein [Oscillospiraceae bacterium]|nr:PIN domain-containing protein [Oscillospiraceae bacterium]